MPETVINSFYSDLPSFSEFSRVADVASYRTLPDDWLVGVADVVGSTGAIAQGRYKEVNMVGASVISAVLNALGHREFPFVFGGDGAALAMAPEWRVAAEKAMAAVQTWASEEMALTLRAAIVPLRDIQAEGLTVRVARFQAAPYVTYAMFAGGGVSWAEAQMKAGHYGVLPAPAGSRPDLTGLSCRWDPLDSHNGEILSVLVLPYPGVEASAFDALVVEILALIQATDRGGHPVPAEGPEFHWPPRGLDFEVKATASTSGRAKRRLAILAESLLGFILFRTGWRLGRFDPNLYRREATLNTDFRKFDDGLKLTLDIAPAVSRRIEARLQAGEQEGICLYGLNRQKSALMTCIVPSPIERDHLHFVDGGAGGYAKAAERLKARLTELRQRSAA